MLLKTGSFRKANLDEVELPVHGLLYNHLYLDEVELPISIATLNLDGLLPGQSSLDGLHAVAVRCHDIRMHNRGGQSRLGYSQLAAVLAEDRGLKKGSSTRPSK